jgi:positive regulator of sigma E activity
MIAPEEAGLLPQRHTIVGYILPVVLAIVNTTVFAMAGHASNGMIAFAVLFVAGAIVAMYVGWRVNSSEEPQRAAWQVWLFRPFPASGKLETPPVLFMTAVIAALISKAFF